jgi:hypothetical protein
LPGINGSRKHDRSALKENSKRKMKPIGPLTPRTLFNEAVGGVAKFLLFWGIYAALSKLFVVLYEYGVSEFHLFSTVLFILHQIVFWGYNSLLMILDFTQQPEWLYKYINSNLTLDAKFKMMLFQRRNTWTQSKWH